MQGKMAFCEKCLDMLADVGEIPNDKLEILKDIGGVCNEVFHEDMLVFCLIYFYRIISNLE